MPLIPSIIGAFSLVVLLYGAAATGSIIVIVAIPIVALLAVAFTASQRKAHDRVTVVDRCVRGTRSRWSSISCP
ncbi:hypothetical protein BSZ39_07400 [Bowdeniella nasicola]|uniref:Uncharacterized protein n=1 Tax=Bowdeniella nasicola TaxID=208480 RepID=A0A1Q5Q1Z9_9ACTO|nr:hypothetical protein [Bowdeniella nasicola]OKL53827.1 hypothetical protein BSZ39_07400 [Bowdeniella nasicola]